jgi:DNA invertase Pin-like site-specific DNA recombinase
VANNKWTSDTEQAAVARVKAGGVTVLIYTRQSVSDFDDEGRVTGASLAVQERLTRERPEFAKCKTEVFVDADVSGEDIKRRPAYQQMMERLRAAPAGSIGAVAAYDLSRFHRNTFRTFEFMAELEERRIPVFTVVDGLIRSDDQLSWGVRAMVADQYLKESGRRVGHGKRANRDKGRLQGRAPLGYRTVGERKDRKIVVEPEAAKVVRLLFTRYATGDYSAKTLADWLNTQGVRPPTVAYRRRKQEPRTIWTTSSVRSLLHTVSYLGVIKTGPGKAEVVLDGPGKNVIKGLHPALIDRATWQRCQRVAATNRRRSSSTWTRHVYPLTPILYCARCGGHMRGLRGAHDVLFYRCRASRRYLRHVRPSACDMPGVRAEDMQRALLADLRGLVAAPGVSEALSKGLTKARDPEAEYNTAMAKLDQRITNIKWQQERGDVGNEEYVERMGNVNYEKQALRSRLAAERKAFDPDLWDKKFAAIVAATVAQRTNLDPTALLAPARAQAAGKGRRALAVTGHPHPSPYVAGQYVLGHVDAGADEIEFGLWAARLPELVERIEVEVGKPEVVLLLVPRKEWARYFAQRVTLGAAFTNTRSFSPSYRRDGPSHKS